MKVPSNQELTSKAFGLSARLLTFAKDARWIFSQNSEKNHECRISNMEMGDRLASMGVVQNVKGTPDEIRAMLNDHEIFFTMYPALKDYKILNQVSESVNVNYCRFKGKGPISDRYLVCLDHLNMSEDKNLFIYASYSTNYPYQPEEGGVKAEAILSGLIAQKTSQNTSKVTYISDTDLKGCIPNCLQRRTMKNEGELAGMVDSLMQKWRNKNNQ